MYLFSSLMFAGLFLVTAPPAAEWPQQAGNGVPAVFVLPDPVATARNTTGPQDLPPWLHSRALDI